MPEIKTFVGWDKDQKEIHVIVSATEVPDEYIEANLSDEDIDAWHEGEVTDHLRQLMTEAGVECIEIWGSRTGSEPLSVNVC